MRPILFLTKNNQWYLHTSSCLSHRHHPHLGEHAILLSQKDSYKERLKVCRPSSVVVVIVVVVVHTY